MKTQTGKKIKEVIELVDKMVSDVQRNAKKLSEAIKKLKEEGAEDDLDKRGLG